MVAVERSPHAGITRDVRPRRKVDSSIDAAISRREAQRKARYRVHTGASLRGWGPRSDRQGLAAVGRSRRCAAIREGCVRQASAVAHFEYPTAPEASFEYLRREVKLELGALSDQRRTGHHAARPGVVDDFPAAFPDWRCQVAALELARAFWEKATILQAEHHRTAG